MLFSKRFLLLSWWNKFQFAGCCLNIFFYLFNAFLQSTPSGVISKSGDASGLGEEVVQ